MFGAELWISWFSPEPCSTWDPEAVAPCFIRKGAGKGLIATQTVPGASRCSQSQILLVETRECDNCITRTVMSGDERGRLACRMRKNTVLFFLDQLCQFRPTTAPYSRQEVNA